MNDSPTIDDLIPDPQNARRHGERNLDMLQSSLAGVGFGRSIVIGDDNTILAGNATIEACRRAGLTKLQVVEADGDTIIAVRRTGLDDTQKKLLALYDNRAGELAEWDEGILAELDASGLDLSGLFSGDELAALLGELAGTDSPAGVNATAADEAGRLTLAERFVVPPFSILDARQGYWQQRKRAWLSLGIQSEVGRDSGKANRGLTFSTSSQPPDVYQAKNRYEAQLGRTASWEEFFAANPDEQRMTGTSIFDPVVCELAYRWFCPAGGNILDPFAGGSVRGVVASRLGRPYTGIELRPEQVTANIAQAEAICTDCLPSWIVGDSKYTVGLTGGAMFDFLFSCPPYSDLEVYSDDPADLSTMDYGSFLGAYGEIITECAGQLREDRFAVFVVGDIRDKKGFYRNFVAATIEAFQDAGLMLYNEAILINQSGSLPIRVGGQFGKYRKLGKTHQNVLVFYKGDPRNIPEIFGEVEYNDLPFGATEAGFDTEPGAGEIQAV